MSPSPKATKTQPIQGARAAAIIWAPPSTLTRAQANASQAAAQFENARQRRKNSPTPRIVARRALLSRPPATDIQIAMRVSEPRIAPIQAPAPSGVNAADQLRAALLRRLLEAQQEQAEQIAREVEGKGTVLDIRV